MSSPTKRKDSNSPFYFCQTCGKIRTRPRSHPSQLDYAEFVTQHSSRMQTLPRGQEICSCTSIVLPTIPQAPPSKGRGKTRKSSAERSKYDQTQTKSIPPHGPPRQQDRPSNIGLSDKEYTKRVVSIEPFPPPVVNPLPPPPLPTQLKRNIVEAIPATARVSSLLTAITSIKLEVVSPPPEPIEQPLQQEENDEEETENVFPRLRYPSNWPRRRGKSNQD